MDNLNLGVTLTVEDYEWIIFDFDPENEFMVTELAGRLGVEMSVMEDLKREVEKIFLAPLFD